ncbi:hypothetical protein FSW04_03975 [Baekduia soli]|uniref:Flagellar hook-length control protein FliK n=1 Tax=Baekduia soli TaxID=496014 RepID=A0A5B8U1X3_9ACTN|nr:hypothetical protein [Baekduia soli]QEC46825.1 hypothetical protein FSW04_03975 [Baekduia soli]
MPGPVDVVLLRGLLPDVTLRPGAILSGRVLDARTLVLAGVRLAARLPEGVEAGQHLRLRVEEAGSERIHLRVVEQAPAAPAAPAAIPPAAYALALPGGAAARVFVQEREDAAGRGGRAAARSVVVRYDSPTLGRMDVRLDRGAAAVHVSAGEAADRVRGAADVLREALSRVAGAPVQVTVHPREETLDVRA